jgi:hypothetical protein
LDPTQRHALVQVALDKIDLPPLQGFAQSFWAGTLTSGRLSAKAQVQTDFAPDKFNVLVQPADLSLEALELHAPGDTQKPVKLKNLAVALDKFDLSARRAVVKSVRLDGLSLPVRRSRDGVLSLDAFLRTAGPRSASVPALRSARPTKGTGSLIEVQNRPPAIIRRATSKPAPVWHYQIASVAIENAETEVEVVRTVQPIILKAAPLSVHMENVSSDLSKPIALNVDTMLKPYGAFKIEGTVAIVPFAAKLHVVTTKFDLSAAEVMLGRRLSPKLNRAVLTVDGNLEATRQQDNFTLSYRGNAETEAEVTSTVQPIILKAAPLNVDLKNVPSDLSKPIALDIDATLKPYGGFKIDGSVAIDPPAAQLHVVTNELHLSPGKIYSGRRPNLKLTQAVLSMDGNLELARKQDTFTLSYGGNATLGDLLMTDKATNETFLRWGALRASRIDASIGNGLPRVAIGEVVLADFYAPLILNSNGTLNLNNLAAVPKVAPKSITHVNPVTGYPEAPTVTLQQAAAAPSAKPPIAANIRLGRITLQGGEIDYTDNFIRPHYTVDLTNLEGKIDGFGTRSTKPAEVEVHGLINSVSPIDIIGLIDPLAPEAFVDIEAKADGYQLINFTPYSAKYLGYPITKGMLKVDVHYLLRNSQLTATNHLFISQLTFGAKVPSPSARNLPIELAVALLKNRRGEIDLTMPVSGSINDPHFGLGALYLQALRDVIRKIARSPFSVVASVAGAASGSSERLQYVAFPPGVATLTPAATSQVLIVANAMQHRPGLRLTMTPRVDPGTDLPGLRAVMVDQLIKMQKVNELSARGEIADVATVELTPDEYDKYLTVVYQQAKFVKPRNSLGMDRSLSPAVMKKLLAENMKVTDDDLRKLAIARVVAVGHYLDRQVDPARLVVVPPDLSAPAAKAEGQTTGVELTLN